MFLRKFFFLSFFLIANLAVAAPYFEPQAIDFTAIDQPFVIGDEKWQQEVAEIIKIQSDFALERLDQAAFEKELSPETLVLSIDKKYQRKKYPKLYAFLDHVGETSYKLNRHFKEHYRITRPFLASKKVKNLIKPSKGYSYPSGHATGSYIYAYALGMVFEGKKEEYLKMAQQISDNRILVGMHYPQDIAGGKQLALAAMAALIKNEEFLRDLEAARNEVGKK